MSRIPALSAALVALALTACSSSGQAAPPSSPAPALTSAIPSPSSSVATHHRRHKARHHKTHPPSTPAAVPVSLCGAPSNPYRLNLCGRGSFVYSPPSDVCSYFNCIANFPNGRGYMVECQDGTYSMSGGISGACSHHDGESKAVTRG